MAGWLDVLSLTAWGILLLKLRFSGMLELLVHPRYFVVVLITACLLLFFATFRIRQLLSKVRKPQVQHLSMLPPGWSSAVFLGAALLGFLTTPQPLNSQYALQQGVGESLISTRVKAQSFQSSIAPQDRSLVDWARTLAVYPEPDAYAGQQVKVQGFVVHAPSLPDEYFALTRFVIGHCALDAYPVSLPVQLTESRKNYPPDTWLEVEGQMIVVEFGKQERLLTVQAKSLKPIATPKNPYEY